MYGKMFWRKLVQQVALSDVRSGVRMVLDLSGRADLYYCHRNHYQINSLGIFPGNVPVTNITELIVGEFSSGNSLQDFVHGISVRLSWDW